MSLTSTRILQINFKIKKVITRFSLMSWIKNFDFHFYLILLGREILVIDNLFFFSLGVGKESFYFENF